MRIWLAKMLHWVHSPGFVQPGRYSSKEHGLAIEVRTSAQYTTLIVGGTEFFFNREDGRYDGYGVDATKEGTAHGG